MRRRVRPSAATLVAIAILIVGVGTATLLDASGRRQNRSTDRDRAATDLTRFQGRVDLAVTTAALVAAEAAAGQRAFGVAANQSLLDRRVVGLVLVQRDGRSISDVVARRDLPPLSTSGDASSLAGLTAAIEAASSAGQPRVGGPVPLADDAAVVIAAPVYPAGTATDSISRRAAVSGYVVAVIPYRDLRAGLGRGRLWQGADVEIGGSRGAFDRTRVGHPVLTGRIDTHGAAWDVRVGPYRHHARTRGWLVAALSIVASAAAFLVLRRQQDARRHAETQARDRARQLEMIADTSAELQQSLDLADLLPAFALSVAAEYDLDHLAVLLADDEGRLLEAFRLGEHEHGRRLEQIPLRRGWRAVGSLDVSSRRSLDDVERQSLQALADLLAVAVSNAQMYEREQQAVARLSELDTMKNAFLGTVSHELRTSTTAVQGFGELLDENWDALPDQRRRELAGRIRRQAGSLRHLVDDLLDYARLEHHSFRVAPRLIELSHLVAQLADSMSPLVANHDVVVEADHAVEAFADPIAVERILANLLSNAGKYSPAGTTVRVGVEHVDNRARLWVADQGPGIPADERRRVFVRFYRLTNAETLGTRGAGIGLSILHDFAERSGAVVTIDDAPGGGALISVDFPTAPDDIGEDEPVKPRADEAVRP